MTFLLDPNVAYLVIVAGFLLMLFAILAPGTGMLELGALFLLIVSGWQIYNLPINIWALVILVVGLIPFIQAVRRKNWQTNLALAALTFVVGSSFLFRGEVWYLPAVNPILAVVVSLLGGGLLWVMTSKVLEAGVATPAHDLGILVGAIGEARTDVEYEGSVFVGGEMWTARSEKMIPAGALVRVLAREGFVLIVEAADAPEV